MKKIFLKSVFMLFFINYVNAQTVASVAPCPSIYSDYCKNSGFCVILFGRDLSCTCTVGYTGQFCEISELTTTTRSTTQSGIVRLASNYPNIIFKIVFFSCPSTSNICRNGGACFVINNANFFCGMLWFILKYFINIYCLT